MSLFRRRGMLAVTAVFLATGLMACDLGVENTDSGGGEGGGGGGEGEGGSGAFDANYLAPNNWRLELDDEDDFRLEERTKPVGGTRSAYAAGTFGTLSSGFSRLTVAPSGVTGDAPAANSELNALEVEDELVFVQNWLNDVPRITPFIPRGECPSSRFSGNWIQLTRPNSDLSNSTASAFFGDLYVNFDDQLLESDSRFALTTDFPEQEDVEPLDLDECESGIIETEDLVAYFGENGSALVHQDRGTAEESLWLALPQSSISSDDLSGSYVGYWIDYGRATNDQTWPVVMECAEFSCTLQRISDIEDKTTITGEQFDIELDEDGLDEPIAGFVTGTSVTPEGTLVDNRPLSCIASDNFNDTGNKVLVCVGQSPATEGYTVNGVFVAAD